MSDEIVRELRKLNEYLLNSVHYSRMYFLSLKRINNHFAGFTVSKLKQSLSKQQVGFRDVILDFKYLLTHSFALMQ